MASASIVTTITAEEKKKVAYALNLCAVSVSQIIDSKDINVLKQEREHILNNLNLQHFVKHSALLEIIKEILDTITYLEIQAGDLDLIEREHQQKLNNAIWSAIPSVNVLFAGEAAAIAVSLAVQVGIGYMSYRRNKAQYADEALREKWKLKRHEIEQLQGLRYKLFETAWRLADDYDFDDKFRLTGRQLSRYSEALLEPDPLKRFERLDVMSDKFEAFPPFWYHKGNAAMEVFRSDRYTSFSSGYKDDALTAYKKFESTHFPFLREDIIAATCCIEHISLLEPGDVFVQQLLQQAIGYADDNFDVLQQSIFVNLQLGNRSSVVVPLRKMIANDYNVELNGILLSRIYFDELNKREYDKLVSMVGAKNVLPWAEDAKVAERDFANSKVSILADSFLEMSRRIVFKIKTSENLQDKSEAVKTFQSSIDAMLKYVDGNEELACQLNTVVESLKQAAVEPDGGKIEAFYALSQKARDSIVSSTFNLQIAQEANFIVEKMKEIR